jgi:hypothetical protein
MRCIVNFEKFVLSFTNISSDLIDESENDIDEDFDIEEAKSQMEDILPNNAIRLGSIETEVEGGISFDIYDDYYIIPISDLNFNYAVFRLSWDDNWEKWQWCCDARIESDIQDINMLSKLFLEKLWDHWRLDWKEDDSYKSLIQNL